MIQDGPHLFYGHAGEPLNKLIDSTPIFQIFEESRNGDTRATKNPSAAYALGITLNRGTSRPIQHSVIVARECQCVKPAEPGAMG